MAGIPNITSKHMTPLLAPQFRGGGSAALVMVQLPGTLNTDVAGSWEKSALPSHISEDTGPLCLGSIIRSTSTPQYPLNRGNLTTVADTIPPVVETDWKKTVSTKTGFGLGVYAQLLQLATGGLPLGPEVNVNHSNETVNTFAFDSVTTLAFEPTQEFVEEAIKAPAVQTWLREPKQRFAPVATLFLVTGMKLVKGARIKY
ncbi:hypothetical protein F4823DRAFT_638009 [Ustulina deusta]|nr:hypothetical protein F4823DRAFT_638009 [Ustulina deusta]